MRISIIEYMDRKTYNIDNIDSGVHVQVARVDSNSAGKGFTDLP